MRALAPIALVCAGVAWSPATQAPPPVDKQVFTRHWTPRDQQIGRYQYVPFDVTPGTTRITVAYRYDRGEEENVIDLGLFEPGPLTLGSPAFRGWSGGARERVTVGVDQATPGYWPGAIPAGRWHVILGLYKVGADGVDVDVTVETSRAPAGAPPALGLRAAEPLRRAAAWYVGALHTHTVHSDGALTAQQLLQKAAAENLDFLAITDHNNTTHQLESLSSPDVLVITGEEVTTPGGHFGVLGLEGERVYVDFRVPAGVPEIASVMRAARERGALIAINHPIDDCLACSWTHPLPDVINAIEIANGDETARQRALTLWDALLRDGRRVTAIGESDWHRGTAPLGVPGVRVWASELSRRAILEAIAAGRVIVMADGSLPTPTVTVRAGGVEARIGDELRVKRGEPVHVALDAPAPPYRDAVVELHWNGEQVASASVSAAGRAEFERFPGGRGYLRLHVSSARGEPLAITNPVFVEIQQ